MMRLHAIALWTLAALLLAGCGPTRKELRRSIDLAESRAPTALTCQAADACAIESPLQELADRAFAASTDGEPRHFVRLLESGQDALLARIHLIRSARESLDLQSFIYAEDDAGYFVINELLQAARRGVRVRVLLDQLYSFEDVEMLARLAQAHANFSMRLYNPTFGRARTGPLQFAAGVICCFFRFNQRMHNKLLLVDGRIGVTGGRNYQNRYFDWDEAFNYRDRDVLLAGPGAGDMQQSFDTFWTHSLSVPIAGLRDVAPLLLDPAYEPQAPAPQLTRIDRIREMSRLADDTALVQRELAAGALEVGEVEYISDLPGKPNERAGAGEDTGQHLRGLLEDAEHEIVLQTPYLVLSRNAKRLFRELHDRPQPPRVIVSSNSLASTDAFPVYALSHKYKRSYLRDYGFTIYEYKPFPESAPIDLGATGAIERMREDGGAIVAEGDAESPASTAERVATAAATQAAAEDMSHAGDVPLAAPPQDARQRRQRRSGGRDTGNRDANVPRPMVLGARATESARRFRLFGSARRTSGPVPLEQAGVRVSMHSKSLVIDAGVAVIGTHNFDPRSDHHNTESIVVVPDPEFARRLRAVIMNDTLPGNAWVIAPRAKPPVLSGLNYSVGKVFEQLPLFDFWPWRYATSWEYRDLPGCTPVPPEHPRFTECYQQVGDFPGVQLELKGIYTRILTAFGAGLAPIL